MKKNYVYEIKYPNGMKYIGVRTSKCEPELDTKYTGSSKIIPEDMRKKGIKTILKKFHKRSTAVKCEAYLHKKYNVALSKDYYNQVCQTSVKFDQQGTSMETHPHVARAAEKHRGRSAETHEYIRKANEKRRLLKGENQTEAQKAGNKRMGDWNRGRKNPLKGHLGAKHPKFKPWYYITPENKYVEIKHNSIRGFIKENPDFPVNLRAIFNRTREQNIDKIATQGMAKGWVFGYINNE